MCDKFIYNSGGSIMRLRKDVEGMQEEEILLVAQVSDALAHPARIKIY